MNEPKTTVWPLLFTYSGTIIGRGFLASVRLCGRLLATQEVEGIWLDGVNPGALAVGGPSLEEANLELRETITKVLVGYASESPTFDAFHVAVARYYHQNDEETVATWDEALAEFKSGHRTALAGLQRKPADWTCFVSVDPKRLEDLTPQDNPSSVTDSALLKAA